MVEVIMAILILMVGILGLLQAINLATEVNMRNQVREEAVFMGERVMNELRGKGFDNISTLPDTYAPYTLPSKLRGVTRSYNVQKSATVISSDSNTKQLEVTVTWSYKGVGYQNKVVAPISILR